MVHRSMENLKLDRRLACRRGWTEPEEHAKALDSLPDVAEKAESVDLGISPQGAAAPEGRAGDPPSAG